MAFVNFKDLFALVLLVIGDSVQNGSTQYYCLLAPALSGFAS